MNEGSFGGSKHIGRGTVPLKSLITDKNQHFSFVVPLTHYEKNGKSATGALKGQAIVRGFLEGPKVATVQSAPTVAPVAVAAPAPVVVPSAPSASSTPAVTTAPVTKKFEVDSPAPTAPVVSQPVPDAAKSAPEKAKPVPVVAAPVPSTDAAVAASQPTASQIVPQSDYDDSKPLKLRLSQLAVRDLKDKGSALDKQDPAVRISVGDSKPFDTSR